MVSGFQQYDRLPIQQNEHHPLEKRRGVRKGGQVFGLAKQVGVGLGEQVDLRNLVVSSALDSGENKAKEVLTIEKPVGTENVEDIKDTWVIKRSDPTLGHWPYATRCRHTSMLIPKI